MGLGHIRPLSVLLLILLVCVLFGGRRIRELGADLAEGIKAFKRAFDEQPDPPASPSSEPAAPRVVRSDSSEGHP